MDWRNIKIMNLTIEMIRKSEFYKTRPQEVRDLMEKVPPTHKYKLIASGQECTIHSYAEEGTLSILRPDAVLGQVQVFGVKPDDIEMLSDQPLEVNEEAMGEKVCIVKVQRSQVTNAEVDQMLIYDESKEFQYEGPLTQEVANLMGDQPKIYCEAALLPNVKEGGEKDGSFQFSLIRPVDDQEW